MHIYTQTHVRVYTPHFFSPADEHLACFHFLTVVNKDTMNMGVRVTESLLSVLVGIGLGVELLDHIIYF